MATVTFENVSKRFGDVVAVDDLSLDIRDAEFMVLVGPSGCGKTTSLRMIAGLEEITSGVLRIGERIINEVPPKDRDIAMVFQSYALYPHMSIRDNLAFGLKLRHVPKAQIETRVKEAASASASPSAERSCASPRSSSWMSRFPTSTPSCASRPAPTSCACTSA
jgi:multiple sugar transport system ATP-binding protein